MTGTTIKAWVQKYRKWLVPLGLTLLIKVFSLNGVWVESFYSTGLYPVISAIMRFLLGWLPFSVGDIGYGLAVLWLIAVLYRFLRDLIRKRVNGRYLRHKILKSVRLVLWIYIIFNLLWGLNYNRPGIAHQLGLNMGRYTVEELKTVNGLLMEKVNACRAVLDSDRIAGLDNKTLFSEVKTAYKEAEKKWPFMRYDPVSLKSSVWGWLGNYTGFTGYYNPFSAEAQVNTTVPRFLLPFTTCHEVGHQLGYARENEANFAGYLSAVSSTDTLFLYSTYLDLFIYANRNLYQSDTAAANQYRRSLSVAVQQDLDTWRKFNLRHRNPFEPVVRWLYGLYLRSNQQPSGLLSYDEVTAFVIAWYKKYGAL